MGSAIDAWGKQNGVTPVAPTKSGVPANSAISQWATQIDNPAPAKPKAPPSTAQNPGPIPQPGPVKGFFQSVGKVAGDFEHLAVGSGSLPAQVVKSYTNPSDEEQKVEKPLLPTSKNPVLNALQAPARVAIKGAVRTGSGIVEGLGKQIASIVFSNETADSITKNPQFQTIGKQVQSAGQENLNTSKLTPSDYVETVMNSANVALPIAGMITDFFGMAGDKLATKGTDLHVTPEQIGEVLKSETSMPPEARIILEHLKENGQGFDLNLKRPAGGLRQTVGEALGGTAERATTFQPTGDVNPQLDSGRVEPFSHENTPQALALKENGAEIQPFAHEASIPEQRVSPFAHETAGAVGGSVGQNLFHGTTPEDARSIQQNGVFPGQSQIKTVGGTPQETAANARYGGGFSLSASPEVAKGYGEVVLPMQIKSDAKIATYNDVPKNLFKTTSSGTFFNQSEAVKWAKDNGYDGINLHDLEQHTTEPGNSQEVQIFNPEVVKPSTSTTLHAELVPGLSKTIAEDIIPKARGAAQRASDIYHEIATLVNPTGQAPKEALDIIMKNKGDYEKTLFRTQQSMKSIEKGWDKQPEENRLAFMEKVETGQDVGGENRDLAKMYRERLNNAYTTIAQYKDGVNFLENYFPHMWKDVKGVGEKFMPEILKRRPLEGSKSFLKQRIFQTIQEGMEAGYKPASTNPETIVQNYEASVAKFKMAQQIKADLKTSGLEKYVQGNGSAPAGYDFINDNIARTYFPQGTIQTPQGPREHFAQAGRLAYPTPVARLINNHLSTDWINSSATGRTLMQTKNSLNAIQLGFSAFHASFETILSTINGIDIAISKTARGDIGGALKEVAKAPFNVVNYWRDGQKFYNGDPELLKIEDDLFHGGASLVRKNQYFKNTVMENFGKNVREGNIPGALGRLPFAAIEGGARLIMAQVPKVKIGAFRALFANELERYAQRGQLGNKTSINEKGYEVKTKETIAREVWNNIENRFGQLNYDNLFWHRTFKAINMLTWRAVGWNVGAIKEFGGAATQDIYRFAQDTIHGRKPDLTPKMRVTMATIATVAVLSAIYEYLHTGHGPKQLKDFIVPENGATDANGDPVRINWPAYSKDMLSYSTNPKQTVFNKASPELSMIFSLLSNRDYYGNYVYNPNDELPTKLNQSLKYVAKEFLPFSITNILELNKGKATTEEKIEGFLGMQKAPNDVIQSGKTKAIFDAMPASGPKTPEEQQQSQLKNDYRKQIQNGKTPSFQELKNAGLVTNAVGYRKFIKDAQMTPSERAYQSLPKAKKSQIPK